MERVAGALALVALLTLAGCSGFVGESTPADTVTPAPVPSETGATANYPPGVDGGEVASPVALANTHHDALEQTPYGVRRVETVTHEGTRRVRTRLAASFSADRSRFRIDYTETGPGGDVFDASSGRLRLWSDGERLHQATTVDGETTYETFPAEAFSRRDGPFDGPGNALGLRSHDREVYLLFLAVGGRVEQVAAGSHGTNATRGANVTRGANATDAGAASTMGATATTPTAAADGDGPTHFRVRSDRLAQPTALENLDRVENPSNVRLTATLTGEGVLRSYRLSYDATVDGRRVRVERRVRYVGAGSTTVERPAWVRTGGDGGGDGSERADGTERGGEDESAGA